MIRLEAALVLASIACAQDLSHRGFLETQFVSFPQTAPNDRGRFIGEALFRYEASYRASPGWRLNGAIDAGADTHHQVDRAAHLSWWDRERRRPALAVRRLSAQWNRGPVTFEIGKQFVRWGKADILNPTDRFAPRDFLNVVDNDFLAIPAVRLTVEAGADTVDLVWQARFTPSRVPLLDQRWVVLPEGVRVIDAGARYPGGPQFGARWNHIAAGYEYSVSLFDGFNHLPLLEVAGLAVARRYAEMRMYGGDAAIPLRWFTLKGEAAVYDTAENYALYVIQFERDWGEWSFTGGYAGELTGDRRTADFAPDRGLAEAFLGRAFYTIDTNRTVTFEAAVRHNGDGVWVRSEYSQAVGQHWRATAAFTLIRGERTDFLGHYRRNSHATLTWRYSF